MMQINLFVKTTNTQIRQHNKITINLSENDLGNVLHIQPHYPKTSCTDINDLFKKDYIKSVLVWMSEGNNMVYWLTQQFMAFTDVLARF